MIILTNLTATPTEGTLAETSVRSAVQFGTPDGNNGSFRFGPDGLVGICNGQEIASPPS